MSRFRLDLHNHSCLSPCGSLEMSPKVMAHRAKELGIDMLALTDHNTTGNLPAFEKCCKREGIIPTFGLEVTTQEEIHVICLFEDISTAMEFGRYIEFLLPDIPNIPELFGDQVIVDAEENIEGLVEKNLISSTDISFENLIEEVFSNDGLAIPAHIDRFAFSVTSQLGFLPDLSYSAIEVVTYPTIHETYKNTIIRSSDAHYPQDMGKRASYIDTDTLDFSQLKRALKNNEVMLT